MRIAYVSIVVAALGCEHKAQKDEPSPPPPPGADRGTKPAMKAPTEIAEPVAREPKTVTRPPAPNSDDVRAPTAADLAEYTKDIKGSGQLVATIETSLGTFHCAMYGDKAPITVANFVGLATGKKPWVNQKTGDVARGVPFFDGITFHRVIPGFMIQGGDPLGMGIGGPGYKFGDEFVDDLKMGPGAMAMANAGPGTNGSQFFIMEGERSDLVHHHTIFGQCKELDLVAKMTHVPVQCSTQHERCTNDNADRPQTPITITHITFSKQ
jgi:peptidyl-prolyl cis-trans isomerase A (cyclophilin A)